jgi:hypothetical protein
MLDAGTLLWLALGVVFVVVIITFWPRRRPPGT